jgi:hypothetical protein
MTLKIWVKTPNGEILTRGKDRFNIIDGNPVQVVKDVFIRRLLAEGSLIEVTEPQAGQEPQ